MISPEVVRNGSDSEADKPLHFTTNGVGDHHGTPSSDGSFTIIGSHKVNGAGGDDETASGHRLFNVNAIEPGKESLGSVSNHEEDDPAVIVGIGCRLPGDIRSPSKLWEALLHKRSMQGRVPERRFNIGGFYHPDNGRMGTTNADGGCFLDEDVRQFDGSFFRINNLEARSMDPQQRKLLEVVHECLEDYGTTDISGTNTAVYVGNFTVDFLTMQTRDPDYIHRYVATGSGTAIMANRISHVFNLHGPSCVLDTACSSSIYALHGAVVALKNGDCDGAIVAGANLFTAPEQHLGTAKGGVLSPTSACHTFDQSADGYARAEAVNAVYVKRLSSALRDGDNIRAVIRGTAVNSNGRTPGITQPDSSFQEAVIRRAYAVAGLETDDTDYVECHGTGTAVGDPIEVTAVARAFERPKQSTLMIGSVKTNLGHSEAASGLTSVIKAILAFEKGIIPPTCGVVNVNPKLRLKERNMAVVTEPTRWPRSVRRASINFFGFGGANAHVIMESIGSYLYLRRCETPPSVENPEERRILLPLSAASTKSLESRFAQMSSHLESVETGAMIDRLSFTLGHRRKHLGERGFMLAVSVSSASGVRLDPEMSGLTTSDTAGGGKLPVSFVFTGQGAQYPGMAKELLSRSRVFAETIRRLDSHLQALPIETAPTWSLEQAILDDASVSQINHVTRSQPLCTAIQIALVNLLWTWGVHAASTVGHSSGEIAAAYAAGFLTEKQSILVAHLRGYAVGQLESDGVMMATALGPEAAADLIQRNGLELDACVACVNSPESTTLSGTSGAIDTLYHQLQGRRTFCRKIETGGRAYHSPMMKEVGPLYESWLQEAFKDAPQTNGDSGKEQHATMYSSVGRSGEELRVFETGAALAMPDYWRGNLESPVQFSSALQNLANAAVGSGPGTHLVEIGPHPALKGPIDQIRSKVGLSARQLPYSPPLRRGEDADWCVKILAGHLFNHGHSLNFPAVNGWAGEARPPEPVHDLPPYPWDYTKGLPWAEPRASAELRERKFPRHELLGSLQPAGDAITHQWRNVLQLDEVPWVRDHKLELQTVFPAAGYLALAMEAVSQALDLRRETGETEASNAVYEFRDVNILTALVLKDGQSSEGDDTEIHTTLERRRLSTATFSSKWFDFSISSWASGVATQHCLGSIRAELHDDPEGAMESDPTTSVTVTDTDGYEQWEMAKWYAKLDEEGLSFGPEFRTLSSMQTDCSRMRPDAISTTKLTQRWQQPDNRSRGTYYPVHALTIDACVQASLLGGTCGDVDALRAHVPVYIAKCHVRTPTPTSVGREASIHTTSRTTGPATKQIDGTLRDHTGKVILHMEEVHLHAYAGKSALEDRYSDGEQGAAQRHPCLRVLWKPDISRLSAESGDQITQYVDEWAASNTIEGHDDVGFNAIVASLLDIAGHKTPRMRVLELGEDLSVADQYKKVLGHGTAFPRYRSWTRGEIDSQGNADIMDEGSGPFDAVVILTTPTLERYCERSASFRDLLADRAIIICPRSDAAVSSLEKDGFEVVEIKENCLLAKQKELRDSKLRDREVVLVTADAPSSEVSSFAGSLGAFLETTCGVSRATTVPLGSTSSSTFTGARDEVICVSLLELQAPFLATMRSQEMDKLRCITDAAVDLVWVTASSMLGAESRPDTTLVHGLARALMLERPSFRFSVLDIGDSAEHAPLPASEADRMVVFDNVVAALTPLYDGDDDKEFVQHNGLLHVSRFSPDPKLNDVFWERLESTRRHQSRTTAKLGEAGPLKLAVGRVGLMDSLRFEEIRELPSAPPPGYVDVSVRAVGINAKDVYSLTGRVETRNSATAHEFAGLIEAVGEGVVDGVAVGDRVLVMAPNYFATSIRVPAWSAQKLLPGEDFAEMVTIPVAYITALYALVDRASLRAGESVLVHSGAGAFGTAAIKTAQRLGAVVYTTAGSDAKKAFLARLGVPESHIFHSRDASFVTGVNKATGGRGVDVVINSLVGDLMHDSWGCIAEFGRFVEVGKRELTTAGKLDMRMFLRNTTFTAFDISNLFFHEDQFHRDVLTKRFVDALELYRSGQLGPLPLTTYDVSSITQAYRYFSTKDRVGKVVITLNDSESRVPIKAARHGVILDSDKVYLLVGCLGGLGRSLSRWMMSRGARKFVFLGRTGCDRPSAKRLVSGLEGASTDVTVKVVRGDVSNAADVETAVKASREIGVVGGVVQAAMGLHESLFERMSNEAWHAAVRPKWAGTWNLHNALAADAGDAELDFFLLTSSVSGSVGTATESNYCAANGFLDAFSRWRRQQGKPAVSLGLGMISEVGYLHENPEIEALLLRKGIQPLSEAELLQVVDIGIAEDCRFAAGLRGVDDRPARPSAAGSLDAAHILTGMEPFRLRELMSRGFEVDNGTLQDPRSRILSAALSATREDPGHSAAQAHAVNGGAASAPWLKSLSSALVALLMREVDAGSLKAAVLRLIRKRFSSLVLTPLDQMDDDKALSDFGMDSMLAADLRTWFWNTFKVDVPFLNLLSPNETLQHLAGTVAEKLTNDVST